MEEVFVQEDEFPLAVFVVWVMELSLLLIRHGLVNNPGRCSFGIFSMTVTHQFRSGSGYWPIIGYLVVRGWCS